MLKWITKYYMVRTVDFDLLLDLVQESRKRPTVEHVAHNNRRQVRIVQLWLNMLYKFTNCSISHIKIL